MKLPDCFSQCTTFRNLRSGVSFVEMIIVVAIISIVSAATLPAFKGLSSNQSLNQSAEKFVSDVKLVRAKALAGVVESTLGEDGTFWGVKLCDGGLPDGDTTYQLGYSSDLINPDSTNFVTAESETLVAGTTFECSGGLQVFYFDRLTGQTTGVDSVSVTIFADSDPTKTRVITIYKGGKIEVN